jgi:hypothetical protein
MTKKITSKGVTKTGKNGNEKVRHRSTGPGSSEFGKAHLIFKGEWSSKERGRLRQQAGASLFDSV